MIVPTDVSDSGTLVYSTTAGSTSSVIYPTSSAWTDWDSYFSNSDPGNLISLTGGVNSEGDATVSG